MAIEDSGFGIQDIRLQDNSIRQVTATSTLGLLSSIHPIFSSDGQDNVIAEPQTFTEVLSKYGEDFADINKYGQQNLLVQQVYEAGAKAYICRLLPDDARVAHLVLKIGVKAVDSIPLYEKNIYGEFKLDDDGNKIPIKVKKEPENSGSTEMIEAKTTGFAIKVIVESADEQTAKKHDSASRLASHFHKTFVDSEGYTIVPLFFASYYANGRCGNDYGVKLLNDFKRDEKVGDGRRYRLFLVRKTKIGAETLPYGNDLSFSFNPNATISKNIPSIEGLQKIYQNYEGTVKKPVQIEFYMDNYEILAKKIEELLETEPVTTPGLPADFELSTPKSINDFDFINGFNKEGYSFDTVLLDEKSEDLSYPKYFNGGNDGAFENLTGDELQTKRDELLKKFFSCLIDTKTITNVLKCDGGIMFDANYSLDVKKSMLNVKYNRRDINVVFDCNFAENLNEAVAVAKVIRQWVSGDEGGENYAIVPHSGTTVDRIINVRATGTYEFAYGFMRLNQLSPFDIYASKPNDNGCVRKMIFDWVVEETIPKGYEIKLARQNRLYYAIDLGKAVSSFAPGNLTGRNIYFFSNANLYKEPISKLSEFRNSVLVNDIRRVLKLVLVKYTFDSSGAENAIKKASEELTKIIGNRYPTNILITFSLYQTDRDKLLNQATCKVIVLFPDVFETWDCTIVADRASDPLAA